MNASLRHRGTCIFHDKKNASSAGGKKERSISRHQTRRTSEFKSHPILGSLAKFMRIFSYIYFESLQIFFLFIHFLLPGRYAPSGHEVMQDSDFEGVQTLPWGNMNEGFFSRNIFIFTSVSPKNMLMENLFSKWQKKKLIKMQRHIQRQQHI